LAVGFRSSVTVGVGIGYSASLNGGAGGPADLAIISTRGLRDALVHAHTFGLFGNDNSDDYLIPNQKAAYWRGRLVGDATAIAMGHGEMRTGGGIALATGGETLGLGALGGAAVAGYGGSAVYNATRDAAATTQKLATLYMSSNNASNNNTSSENETTQNTNQDGGVKLTGSGKKAIGNLQDLKDVKARDALKLRGGNNSAINQGDSGYWDKPLGEIANLAGQKDGKAETILKLVKQASSKAQKYGGK
jgi:hypothetical protein